MFARCISPVRRYRKLCGRKHFGDESKVLPNELRTVETQQDVTTELTKQEHAIAHSENPDEINYGRIEKTARGRVYVINKPTPAAPKRQQDDSDSTSPISFTGCALGRHRTTMSSSKSRELSAGYYDKVSITLPSD